MPAHTSVLTSLSLSLSLCLSLPRQLELRKLEDRLSAVQKEMQYQREREESHRDTVSLLHSLSLLLCPA